MAKKITKKLSETQKIAEQLAKDIIKNWPKQGLGQQATILAMTGDLGSGKTSFTQGFAKALGIKDRIISPTFVIMKIYKIRQKEFHHLIHIDAYRFDNPKELDALGWKEMIKDPKNIIIVEWAEKVKNILPKNAIQLKFEHVKENERKITIKKLT